MYSRLREKFLYMVRTSSPFFVQDKVHSFITNREYSRWLKSGKPMPPPRIVKQNLISNSKKETGYNILVETGTYQGEMIFYQLKNFKKLFSIELDEKLYENAKKRFKNCSNVTLIQGDSGKVLKQITDQLNEPAIFWLDGHYSAGVTAMGEKQTPIFEELRTIFSTKINHAILIDDARLFAGTGDYPTMEGLTNFVHQYYPGLEIKVSDDCIQFVLKN